MRREESVRSRELERVEKVELQPGGRAPAVCEGFAERGRGSGPNPPTKSIGKRSDGCRQQKVSSVQFS